MPFLLHDLLFDPEEVIEATEKDKLLLREIMMLFKCVKTQVYRKLKQEDKIMNEWQEFKIKIHVSGPMVQSEALTVAKSLGNDQFKATTGWSDSFKKRHNIVWNGVCGESKDVDESVVSVYKPKLLELISPYELKNIYNADETGLFFSGVLSTKSLAGKGENCTGGKMSKERLTVSLCGNMKLKNLSFGLEKLAPCNMILIFFFFAILSNAETWQT
jgi:hypothetical protein